MRSFGETPSSPVQETDATIDVLPIRAGSEESDRIRIGRYWRPGWSTTRGVIAELVDDGDGRVGQAAS